MTPLPPTPDLKAIDAAVERLEAVTAAREEAARRGALRLGTTFAEEMEHAGVPGVQAQDLRLLLSERASLQAENARLKAAHEAAAQQCIDADAENFANARRAEAAEAGLAKALGALEETISLQVYVNNPSAWDDFSENVSEALRAVVARASQVHAELTSKTKAAL
jgi:hypothetical protein